MHIREDLLFGGWAIGGIQTDGQMLCLELVLVELLELVGMQLLKLLLLLVLRMLMMLLLLLQLHRIHRIAAGHRQPIGQLVRRISTSVMQATQSGHFICGAFTRRLLLLLHHFAITSNHQLLADAPQLVLLVADHQLKLLVLALQLILQQMLRRCAGIRLLAD